MSGDGLGDSASTHIADIPNHRVRALPGASTMFIIDLRAPDLPLYEESGEDSGALIVKAEAIVDAYFENERVNMRAA